jgi:hypothetical protein
LFFDKTVTSILLHKTRPFKFFACSFSVETGPLLIHPSLSQVALLCVCLYVCGVGVLLNYTVCDVCRPFFCVLERWRRNVAILIRSLRCCYRFRDRSSSCDASSKRYVITNPPDDFSLMPTDQVTLIITYNYYYRRFIISFRMYARRFQYYK